MDFTINIYKNLLTTLQKQGFSFQTFAEYMSSGNAQDNSTFNIQHSKLIILRHDVDALPQNSLRFARIQAEMGIKGTYYFRIVPQSFDERIIKEIAELGHEIGYHYETMDTCKGDVDQAFNEFCRNLEKFQKLTEIKTISMHGSPLSKFDNRDIWKKYDYKKLGLLAEPYFDIDFNHLFYLTDTGRRWDGHRFNVRDKPMVRAGEGASKRVGDNPNKRADTLPPGGELEGGAPESLHPNFGRGIPSFSTTHDIIRAIESGNFPYPAMLNFHPQRWHNKPIPWLKEFIWQNVKNQGKRVLIAARKKQ